MESIGIEVRAQPKWRVDYTRVEDVAAYDLGEGEVNRVGGALAAVPGWHFEISAMMVIHVGDDMEATEWESAFEGTADEPLDVVVARVVHVMQEYAEEAAKIAVHTIDGSEAEFDREFADAFDRTVGAPHLLPTDL